MSARSATWRFLALSLVAAVLAGCASQHPPDTSLQSGTGTLEGSQAESGAVVGAVAGAVVGGILGYLIGGDSQGAVIGAAAGAAVGGAVGYSAGKHQDKALAKRNAVVREIGYTPGQGDFLKLESVRLSPQAARPGQTVNLICTYVAIPSRRSETPEVYYYEGMRLPGDRQLLFKNGPVKADFAVAGGGRSVTTVPITLPKSAVPGTYQVLFAAKYGDKYQEGAADLTVTS